ncbi:MAG: hypothetical protein U9N77_05250, partial [Thermodesulfobacteriota bacterium]|nr:hypothetical protein [Thermodesulfobacteriota bacterium]
MNIMGKNITALIFALLLIVSAACEQQPEKVVSKEPEVVIARIPERVKPAETKPAETKSAET